MANLPAIRRGDNVRVHHDTDRKSPYDGKEGVVSFNPVDGGHWPYIVDFVEDAKLWPGVFNLTELEPLPIVEATEAELGAEQAAIARSAVGDYPGDTAGEVLANAAAAGQSADNPVVPPIEPPVEPGSETAPSEAEQAAVIADAEKDKPA